MLNIKLIDEIPFKESCMQLTGTKGECEKKLNEMINDFGENGVTVIYTHDYKNIGLNRYECLVKVKIA